MNTHDKIELPAFTVQFDGQDFYSADAVRSFNEADRQSTNEWRKLALQFDSHRMQAIGHLKAIVDHLPVDMQSPIRNFLSAPPDRQASGNKVCQECGGNGAGGAHEDDCIHYALNETQIRDVFLANGFTIKPGEFDLKPYVYQAALALLEADRQARQCECQRKTKAVIESERGL